MADEDPNIERANGPNGEILSFGKVGAFSVIVADPLYIGLMARTAAQAAFGDWFGTMRREIDKERRMLEIRAYFPKQDPVKVYDAITKLASMSPYDWDSAFWHMVRLVNEPVNDTPAKYAQRVQRMIDDINNAAAAPTLTTGNASVRIPHFAFTRDQGPRKPISGDGITTAYRYR
jgi:hypothetical protein